jgi:MerR family transcriptional regulator/heat shock protein HspR
MNDMREAGTPRRARREGVRFTISIAAELVQVHAQTLRHYERIGLIAPQRSEGKIRYYTPEDIDRLELITDLIEQRKVNLAGVQAILELQEQMAALRAEYEQRLTEQGARYEGEIARLKSIIRRMNGQESGAEAEPLPSH